MENKTEKWKQVESFPRYLISTQGRAISTVKNITVLKLQNDKVGYKFIRMYPEDARFGHYPNGRGVIPKLEKIHRLVLQAFNPTKNDSLVVNHKNGNKTDNRIENLEWVTQAENAQHAWDIGLMDNAPAKAAIKKRKPVKAIHIDGHVRYFESRMHTCFAMGCSRPLVSEIMRNKRIAERGPATGYRFVNILELPEGEVFEEVPNYDQRIREYNDKYYSKYLKNRKRKK